MYYNRRQSQEQQSEVVLHSQYSQGWGRLRILEFGVRIQATHFGQLYMLSGHL